MRTRIFLRSLLATAAFAATIGGAAAWGETLQEAIDYVYQSDPGLQAQRAALRAIDEGYVQAKAGFGPQATIGYSSVRTEIERGGQTAHATNPVETAVISQPLYTGGRVNARVGQAEAQILAARQNLRRYEADLLQRVINAYVGVQRDEELLRISADAAAVLAKQLQDTQAKFDVRQVTATDLAQSRARLASARTQLAFARGQLAISRAQFVSIVGKTPGSLAPPPPLPEAPRDPDKAFDVAEENSPNLLAAVYTEQASRKRIAEAKAGRRPSVSLRLEGNREATIPYVEGNRTETFRTSLNISQPIFSSGIVNSQIRQATEENNRDRLQIEATRKVVIQQVAESWEALATARSALVTQEEEVLADQTAFYGVREEERLALRSTIEVLNAEAELRSAQLELVRARANEYSRRAQLLAAMGMLSAEIIAPAVQPYDPATNTRKIRVIDMLPTTPVVRALDSVGAARSGRPRPMPREDLTPPTSELPPPPDPAKAVKIVPASELIAIGARTGKPKE